MPSRLYLFMINSPYTVYFQQLSSKPTKSVNLKKLGRKRPAWGGGGGCDRCEVLLLTSASVHLSPQDQVEQTSPHHPRDLAGPGFPAQPDRLAPHQGKGRIAERPDTGAPTRSCFAVTPGLRVPRSSSWHSCKEMLTVALPLPFKESRCCKGSYLVTLSAYSFFQ